MSEKEYTLRRYTQEEYEADMRKAIKEKGLYGVVEGFCEEIDNECKGRDYLTHRHIQELLNDILNAIKLKEETNERNE